MAELIEQRCFNHSRREAVARCPNCRRFFCRECITEHEDRIVCASCLRALTEAPKTRRRPFAATVRVVQFAAGVILLWFFAFVVGRGLLALPSSFHESTLWKQAWW